MLKAARLVSSQYAPEQPTFAKGALYAIIAMSPQIALAIEDNSDNSRIIPVSPNQQKDIAQLWFVQRINKQQDLYQIVNLLSGYPLCSDPIDVSIKKGQKCSDHVYYIERAMQFEGKHYYRIRAAKFSSKVFTMETQLRSRLLDIDEKRQLFRFQKINERGSPVKRSCIIVHVKSGKVLDVPKGSDQEGTKIILWTKNRRLNQRWNLMKTRQHYQIQSLVSGMNLDINSDSRRANSKIIQYRPTASNSQLWSLQNVGNSQFIIRSVHEESLMLGVLDEQNGSQVAVVNYETLWRIDGFVLR